MVAILMGSMSDFPVVQKTILTLEEFGVSYLVKVLSAHRTPNEVKKFIQEAEKGETKVFIGVAGKAAHLPGVIASHTVCPVIGLPVKTPDLGGIDSLLSIVQMPPQIPVATVGIDAGVNAALLAIEMLAISNKELNKKLQIKRDEMIAQNEKANERLQNDLKSILEGKRG